MFGTGNRWRFLALASIAEVLALATWFSATAVLPELIEQWDLRPASAAWLTNGVQAGFVAGALVSSILGLPDRLPLRWFTAGSAALAGLATLSLLTEPGVELAVLARFVTGAALAGVYPPTLKMMATWFRTGRGLALGILIGALTLGSALPHLVHGIGGSFDWRLVLGAAGVLSLIAALIFAVAMHEGPYPFAKGARVTWRNLGSVLRNRPVMLANFGYFGHMWELYAMWGWFLTMARFASESGLDIVNVSMVTFLVVAMGAPGCILGGLLSDRFGRCNTTAALMMISGSSAIAIGFFYDGPVILFLLVALVWGFTVVADSAQFSTAVTELAPSNSVGSALAFQMGVGFSLTIVTIHLVQILAGYFGWHHVFLVLAPGPFLGAWAMLTLRGLPEAAALANGRR